MLKMLNILKMKMKMFKRDLNSSGLFNILLLALIAVPLASGVNALTFEQAQQSKVEQLSKAAANAVAQQRKTNFEPSAIDAEFVGIGGVTVQRSRDWDIDGDGECYKVTLKNIPASNDHVNIADRLAIRFRSPVNLLEKSTGIAFWIRPARNLSGDLRFGAHFKSVSGNEDPVIISDTPLSHKFGDSPHQAYLDWGYCFSHDMVPLKGAPKELFEQVKAIELTFVQKRIPRHPRRSVRLKPASGVFYIDGVQLVDWYKGSYDNSRFPADGAINAAQPIVSQGRTQQVAVICAMFGGDSGAKSAISAMDMMARIQCWDGSWPEIQTRLQGETTHGMILADMARALAALREQKRPELAEEISIRHWKMTRDELYEQMIYRAAISRSPAPMRNWSDSYFTGDGSLKYGCNRPMYFTVAQFVAAEVIQNPRWKRKVLSEYNKNMADLVEYQGITAGGWPIFGEGNRYGGKGLSWDCGYTTDHVFIMAIGSRVTGDDRWGAMMRKFDTVVEAMMLADGLRIDGALSERGHARAGSLKSPDIVYQEATRHGAGKLAQWAYNVSQRVWSQWPNGGSLWTYAASARGYGLGAFLTWQTYDMDAEPVPADTGHVFPRQWPLWTTRWMDKQGSQVRQSKIFLRPGSEPDVNTFKWEIGQYPVVTGLPLKLSLIGDDTVEISETALRGDISALGENCAATLTVSSSAGDKQSKISAGQLSGGFDITSTGDATVKLDFGDNDNDSNVVMSFKMRPLSDNAQAAINCQLLKSPQSYEQFYGDEQDAGGMLNREDVNLADPKVGTSNAASGCYPSSQFPIAKALDGNSGTSWVIGGFRPASSISFNFPRELALGSIMLVQGDYRGGFDVASEVTVTLSDGRPRKLAMPREPGRKFTLDLGGTVSDSLTITVNAVHKVEGNNGATGGWAQIVIKPASSK